MAVPPAAHDAAFEGENVEHLPLILRQAFVRRLDHWEFWLSVPSLLKELRHYCSLCHQYKLEIPTTPGHNKRSWIKDTSKALLALLQKARRSYCAMDNMETQPWALEEDEDCVCIKPGIYNCVPVCVFPKFRMHPRL